MIRYLLDTDVLSQASKRKPNADLLAWLSSVDDQELAISVISVRERWEGAERARRAGAAHAADIASDVADMVAAFQSRVLPIDEHVARKWAEQLVPDRSNANDKGQIAIAVTRGLTLVSLNARDMRGRGAAVLHPGRRPPKLYAPLE